MRGAPPVQVACGPDAPWRWVTRGLLMLAGGVFAAWVGSQLGIDRPHRDLLVPVAAAAAWPLGRWLDGPKTTQVLSWDGQRWSWQGRPGDVAVMLDFGRWLLLRVLIAGRSRWVPVSLKGSPMTVALIRAALQAHAGRALHGDDRA